MQDPKVLPYPPRALNHAENALILCGYELSLNEHFHLFFDTFQISQEIAVRIQN
jgi:hypothetical protein